MHNSVVDFETLRLMKAFKRISDRDARRMIIKIIEAAATKDAVEAEKSRKLDEVGVFAEGSGSLTSMP